MITIEEALKLVLENTPRLDSVKLPIAKAVGHVLGEDISSDREYPPFNRAMMDGFAVKASDAGKVVEKVGEVAAGDTYGEKIISGQCVEIMTGAPCPEGTEAVVKVEDIVRDGSAITLPEKISNGKDIAKKGTECDTGRIVMSAGGLVTPLAVANLAAFGYEEVRVCRKPKVAIITTGDELGGGNSASIRDSNGPMLLAMAENSCFSSAERHHALDNEASIKEVLSKTREVDIVVFSGGVSAGKYDLIPSLLEESGAEKVFHKVRQKPGKPLLFAKSSAKLFFGLPGNPLASCVSFQRYVAAAAEKMAGHRIHNKIKTAVLTNSYKGKCGRHLFLLARARETIEGWQVEHLAGKGSADIFSSCEAASFIHAGSGEIDLKAGSRVQFEVMKGWM